jgi:hypothetical protein
MWAELVSCVVGAEIFASVDEAASGWQTPFGDRISSFLGIVGFACRRIEIHREGL